MAKLAWNEVGSRVYNIGLDHGVLFLPASDGPSPGVAWSGLTGVKEGSDTDVSSQYVDGLRCTAQILGNFQGSLTAFTYPEEFEEFVGGAEYGQGLLVMDQKHKPFHLAYRTLLGNDSEGTDHGYQLHVLYNLTAIPADRTYESIGDQTTAMDLSWDLSSVPPETPGFRRTSHIIIDSTTVDAELLGVVEGYLFGTDTADAALPSMSDFLAFFIDWATITITDNGDGTWTAHGLDRYFTAVDGDPSMFQISPMNAVYSDPDTYTVSTTFLGH